MSQLWSQYDLYAVAYCVKLNGEDLSRYWNKIQSAGLRNCPYDHYLTKKAMLQ